MLGKTKGLVYVRRSQDRYDKQVLSIEGQEMEMAKLIEQHNIAPIFLPAEERTAHRTGRPIFDDMMDRIETGEVSVIVAWSANRLARNAWDGGRIIHYLSEGKITRIITPNRVYRHNMEDEFFLQLEFGMSKMYSDEISKNVKRGYRVKYERGEYPAWAPIGYVNIIDNHHRNIAPDPIKGPLVQKLFQEASTGTYTLDEIWRLAKDKLALTSRTGQQMPKQTLQGLLRNRVYTGVFLHGGEFHQGTYEPLISVDLYDKVQVEMGWKHKRIRNTTSGLFYPYKGVLTCQYCGHNLTAYVKEKKLAAGRTAHYTYYVCTRKSKTLKCKEPQIAAINLEEQLTSSLQTIKLSSEDARECIKLIKKFHKEQTENRFTRLAEWRQEQIDTEKRLARLLDMRTDEEITREEFFERKTELNQRLVRTKELINDTHSNADDWLELAEDFFSSAVTLSDTFKIATDEEKKRILLQVGLNWKLDNKKVQFTPRKPYDLLVNRTNNTNWRG